MKKFIAGLLVGVVLATGSMAIAQQNYKLFVNSKEVATDVAPQMINGRIMVPVRFVSEALGASVNWDGATQRVLITQKQQEPILDWITITALTDYNIKVNFMQSGFVNIITDDVTVTVQRPGFYEGEEKQVKTNLGDVRMKMEGGKQYISTVDLLKLGVKF